MAYHGAISKQKLIDTDSATMESTIALKAELGRLARALKQSEEREETLLSHIETQKSQINKLIERVPQPILINSPITNIVFTPYSRNADVKKRTGPALPSLDIDAHDVNADESQTIVSSSATRANTTPSSYLIATAASSLLSLTPNKLDEQTNPSTRVSTMTLPTLDSPAATSITGLSHAKVEASTHSIVPVATRREKTASLVRAVTERDSPSQTKYIFGALSPLPNAQVWDIA